MDADTTHAPTAEDRADLLDMTPAERVEEAARREWWAEVRQEEERLLWLLDQDRQLGYAL